MSDPAEGRSGSVAGWWIDRLLRLYPRPFRERYGAEMRSIFLERWRDESARSWMARLRLLIRTTANLSWVALRERLDRIHDSDSTCPAYETDTGDGRRRRGGGMRHTTQDVRYTLRFLRRHPIFTAIVLVTLGLGIGMTTAVFSVVYGALYSPLPYADAGTIVRVGRIHPDIPNTLLPISPARFEDLRTATTSLAQLEVETGRSMVLSVDGGAEPVQGTAVSAGFFDLLGTRPVRGRGFTPDDDVDGAPGVVVVSDAFWKTQLGADPGAVGQTIRLDDQPFTVIGIMPEAFTWRNSRFWVPLRLTAAQQAGTGNYLRMIGRLAPGADVTRAKAELDAAWTPLVQAFPGGNEDTRMSAETLRAASTRLVRTPLFILAGAAGFVLLIACANVANLMLVRAERRQREVSVRAALGARRRRLAGQFITEGLAISILGGTVGVLMAWAGVRGLIGLFGDSVPHAESIGLNLPVLAFAVVVSLITGALVGVAPALKGTVDFTRLREGSRGGTHRFTAAGKALVVLEVALAIMLVTGAGLLLKSYARVLGSDLGFNADGLIAVNFWFPSAQYTENAQATSFLQRVTERIEASPDVGGVSMANMVPIREYGSNYTEIGVVGRDVSASFVEIRYVTPGFFETLGIDLLHGRNFDEAEALNSAPVMIITQTLARQLFGEDDPLGWRLTQGSAQPEIIGVVGDVRDFGPDQTPRPIMYRPIPAGGSLLIRSRAEPGAVAGVVRAAAAEIDPAVVPIRIESMSEILDRAVAGRRFQLTLIGLFAATALVLACVGIYGVLSYTVEQQTREIGVRMALGAEARSVASSVAWRGGRWALLGVATGAVGAYATRSTIASQLFAVESFDFGVYAAVAGTLLTASAIACLVPARRAAITDPVRALNAE